MTTVLVMTCKRFQQVWDPFFTLFKRYWPDCPYKLVMCTDFGSYEGVETITIGKDLGCNGNCIAALNKIKDDRVIVFFEDFLPCKTFNSGRIDYLVNHSYDYDVACLRLMPCPGPTADWKHDKSLGLLQVDDPYRFSWQTAIWNREVLISLLDPSETPWQTEVAGSRRTALINKPFVSVRRGECPIPYIATAVVKGCWLDSAIEFLKKEGISTKNITKTIL